MTSLMTLNQHTNKKKPVIIAILKSTTMSELVNRITGSRLLISSLPGSALRTDVDLLGKPRNVTTRSLSLAW